MRMKMTLEESELATFARQSRIASGKNRAEAARDLKVTPQAVMYAEDCPEKSFTKLRRRMIEVYSPYRVAGPVFLLSKK